MPPELPLIVPRPMPRMRTDRERAPEILPCSRRGDADTILAMRAAMRRSAAMLGTVLALACGSSPGRDISATAVVTGDPTTGTTTTTGGLTPTTTESASSTTQQTTTDTPGPDVTTSTTTGGGPIFDLGGLPDMPPPRRSRCRSCGTPSKTCWSTSS
ncbi:hypothetical protein [Nannocystis pusilla]|uniref:hypothetical protein n=1 Tax=Nannocystis pusilla TaxID=889268 RepID=UPI003B7D140A